MNRPGPTPGAVTGTTSTRSATTECWALRGACRDADPELFFTPEGERGAVREYREADAKAICATCPVLAECRAVALKERIPYGVWGGLTESERTDILADGPGGAVTRSASPAEREVRRTAVIKDLVKLAAEGYSRDEAIIALRIASNWLTRICNDTGHRDLLEKLDANASRPRHDPAPPPCPAPVRAHFRTRTATAATLAVAALPGARQPQAAPMTDLRHHRRKAHP